MAWELIKREDTYESKNQPLISVQKTRIWFNSMFARIAELNRFKAVRVYADSENLRLGFEFLLDQEEDSLTVTSVRLIIE